MSRPDVLSAALEYAALGWHLFPVRGKLPALDLAPRWSQDSSADPEVLVSWFAGSQGLGVAVDLRRSALLVADGDHLEQMPDELRAGLDEAGAWRYRGNPERLSWLFGLNGHEPPQAGHPWGETKGPGGYVVLPPSPHTSGGRYVWLAQPGDRPVTLPEQLEALLAPDRGDDESGGTRYDGGEADELQIEQAAAILDEQCQRVADATRPSGNAPGSRNRTLNVAAFIVGHYVPHYLERAIVVERLFEAAKACGLVADDGASAARGTIRSGLSRGIADPQSLPSMPTLLDVDADDTFWEARASLTHVRDFARARRAAPLGTLGVVLARVVAATAPSVVLPPIVGGEGSLNLFIALVGPSGKGKGACMAAGRDAVTLALEAPLLTPGSGEGIAHMFARREQGELVVHTERVLLDAPEVDTLTALNGRRGATLDSELRKAWSGESIGFGYADPTKRLTLPPHGYRLSLVVGVQPGRAGAMFDAADAGSPQRFVWLPVNDPRAPEQRPDEPKALYWLPPSKPAAWAGRHRVPVCAEAVAAIEADRLTSLRDDSYADSLDGHRGIARLKVAAALGLLEGHAEVTAEDWSLAGELLSLSDRTRERVRRRLADTARASNKARGEAEADRAEVVDARRTERAIAQATSAALRIVETHASEDAHSGVGCRRKCIVQACRSTARDGINTALERAVAAGRLIAEPAKQGGTHYRRGSLK